MKVLILHNRYTQRGGEDACVTADCALLERHGVEVRSVIVENQPEASPLAKLQAAARCLWSSESYSQIREICRQWKPDVAHIHNHWMKLTPAAHAACRDAGVPTVQTLHNYRLACANARLLREGRVCTDCVGRVPWRGLWHRCYRNSFGASAAAVAAITYHRVRHTWRDVNAFIAISDFVRNQLAQDVPVDRVFVRPNFVVRQNELLSKPSASDYVLFAGRLSEEKGCYELVRAWISAGLGQFGRLLIAGDGPEEPRLRKVLAATDGEHRVEILGGRRPNEILELMKSARAVVIPSVWHEPFGLVAIEAYSCGRPVIAARRGALQEIVVPGETGWLFEIESEDDTSVALRAVLCGAHVDRMGAHAFERYLAKYTPERNYQMLAAIYREVIDRAARPSRKRSQIQIPGALWTSS